MRRVAILTVATAALCTLTSHAQNNCGCQPQRRLGYQVTRPLRVTVAGIGGDDLEALKRGLNYWNGYFAATYQDSQVYLQYEPGADGDIQVSIDPSLSTSAVSTHNADGTGTIRFPPSVLNNQSFMQAITGHETGHNLGFMNVGGSCAGRTIMFESISPSGGHITQMTQCDNDALRSNYPQQNPPPGGWCENGGCTPGYAPMGSTGCSEASPDECGCCLTYSPIVLDLGADGVRFSSVEEGANFFISELGQRFRMGWPESPDDVWLWLDRNENGLVDSGGELFGNATRLASGIAAANGFVALAEQDGNGDGRIDAADPAFAVLKVWSDSNRDGVSQLEEIGELSATAVISIDLDYRESRRVDRHGNAYRYRSVLRLSGQRRPTWAWDVYPAVAPLDTFGATAMCTTPPAR